MGSKGGLGRGGKKAIRETRTREANAPSMGFRPARHRSGYELIEAPLTPAAASPHKTVPILAEADLDAGQVIVLPDGAWDFNEDAWSVPAISPEHPWKVHPAAFAVMKADVAAGEVGQAFVPMNGDIVQCLVSTSAQWWGTTAAGSTPFCHGPDRLGELQPGAMGDFIAVVPPIFEEGVANREFVYQHRTSLSGILEVDLSPDPPYSAGDRNTWPTMRMDGVEGTTNPSQDQVQFALGGWVRAGFTIRLGALVRVEWNTNQWILSGASECPLELA